MDGYDTMTPGVTLSQGFWVLTRYEDVVEASRDQELFSSHEGGPTIWDFEPEQLEEQRVGIMGMRPADHKAVRKLEKGENIYLSYPAANRDPEVFSDPHKFDITRPNADRHLAFGTGPHVCLGARLARYQLKALLKEIVTRIPDIRPGGEMELLRSIWFNAIVKMPVTFTPE